MKVELFYSPTCPDCPPAKRIFRKLLAAHPEVEYAEINVKENRKRAEEIGLTHVPTILFDGEIVFVEHVTEEEALREIEKRLKVPE
ncbi:MAG: thioredoxin family protein [Thermoplasmata archaeon]|nr:thioredoxin family protein [Thermoplasmata archaeon]